MFRTRTRKRVAASTALLAVLAVAVFMMTRGGGGGESVAQETNASGTTQIERQDLVETEDMDGTLGHSDTREVVNRLSGTVTWLPEVGSVIRPGRRLFEIDDEPVFLLDGRAPAYRTLEPGLSGDDVHQLERNLRRLGYDSGSAIAVDGTWDSGTTAAVYRWQEKAGLDATGVIELGRVIFQPGRRRIADRAVTLGDSGAEGGAAADGAESEGSTASSADTATSDTSATGAAAVATAAETPTTLVATVAQEDECEDSPETPQGEDTDPGDTCQGNEEPDENAENEPEPGAPQEAEPAPQEQTQQPTAPTTPAAPAAGSASAGDSSSGAASTAATAEAAVSTTVMTTTSTRRRVSVDMPTDRIDLAEKGARVEVEMPAGDEVDGRIASVGKVATLPEGEDVSASDATIAVSIRLSENAGSGLDQAPVTVSFERSRAKDVLTVPVTALLAQQGGTFAVEVREGENRRIVAVETGLYTDGFVEIAGDGLREGMTVTDSGL